jgi:hypothetical protein
LANALSTDEILDLIADLGSAAKPTNPRFEGLSRVRSFADGGEGELIARPAEYPSV